MVKLKEKVAIVNGGASGIGKSIPMLLARQGAGFITGCDCPTNGGFIILNTSFKKIRIQKHPT